MYAFSRVPQWVKSLIKCIITWFFYVLNSGKRQNHKRMQISAQGNWVWVFFKLSKVTKAHVCAAKSALNQLSQSSFEIIFTKNFKRTWLTTPKNKQFFVIFHLNKSIHFPHRAYIDQPICDQIKISSLKMHASIRYSNSDIKESKNWIWIFILSSKCNT